MPKESLQFAPFQSFADASFFSVLASKKLNELKLDETSIPVRATYSVPVASGRPPTLSVTGTGFSAESDVVSSLPLVYNAPGSVTNTNTIEAFKELDKAALIEQDGKALLKGMRDGTVVHDPSQLLKFHVAAFSDLKKYKFYYWFAFPAINSATTFELNGHVEDNEARPLTRAYDEFVKKNDDRKQWGFFVVRQKDNGYEFGKLQEYKTFFAKGETPSVGFADPCTIDGVPGWPLRNLVVLLGELGFIRARILAFRDHSHVETSSKSLWIDASNLSKASDSPRVTGWERNASGKLAPKLTDLGALVDPQQLANQAVDLNLRLMKWRIAPELDLDAIQGAKCLLLGAGTLGSYIARALLGWGVRKVTFVDNGKVSFSNPVRQSLYRFTHCLEGGAPKAKTAAESLKEIFPAVEAEGYELEIPMAGHAVSHEARQRAEYDKLVSLIESHDAVFLLMDSRESRWLPTVIASALSKLVINVALGFDSFLVMRHGVAPPSVDHRPHLGCYFCNDVVAPIDSISRLTLDQMCTVTRPGVAMLASATAVELFASVLQHPEKGLAPVPQQQEAKSDIEDAFSNPLSTVPHQLRGFLGNFETMKVWGPSYPNCSACSPAITNMWREQGWDFVRQALDTPDIINEISGLRQVQQRAEELLDENWDTGTGSEGELI